MTEDAGGSGIDLSILKCNLHTHFYEYYRNDAKRMVDSYHDGSYDSIALTEHCGFRESSGFTEKACAYLFEKYGEEFLVVLGQELNFSISTENRHDGIDLLGLFLTEHIDCGWSSGRDPKVSEFITGASVSGVPNSANWSRGLRPNALAFMLNLRRCSLANRSQRPLQCSRYTRISSSR